MTKTLLTGLTALVLLTACSTAPVFDTAGVATHVTPQLARAEFGTAQGTTVVWGGIIIASINRHNATQLEILAYPLNNRQKPRTDQPPLGRFLVEHSGYLETKDYAPGRLITVSGHLESLREGRIGDSRYDYPVVTRAHLHLWRDSGGSNTRLHFGVGVVFSN